jgi:hypothetical protein
MCRWQLLHGQHQQFGTAVATTPKWRGANYTKNTYLLTHIAGIIELSTCNRVDVFLRRSLWVPHNFFLFIKGFLYPVRTGFD